MVVTQENRIMDIPDLNRFKVGDEVVVSCDDWDNVPATVIGIELRRRARGFPLEPSITLLHDGDQITDEFKPRDLRPALSLPSNPGENDLVTRYNFRISGGMAIHEAVEGGRWVKYEDAAAALTAADARIAELEREKGSLEYQLDDVTGHLKRLEDEIDCGDQEASDWEETYNAERQRAETAEARLSEAMKALEPFAKTDIRPSLAWTDEFREKVNNARTVLGWKVPQ